MNYAFYLSSIVLFSPTIVFSQITENKNNSVELEPIIVTATKRAERIQDVPLSISVVTPDALEKRGATDYRDYLTGIAGVSLSDFGTNDSNVIIRGIATAPDGDGSGGTTVTYFDEIALGGGLGATEIQPLDIERIEVLRGPQGTLYGSGSIAGTLRQIPNKPKLGKLSAEVDASIASVNKARSAEYLASAVINVPLGENVAIRAAGFYEKNPNFILNLRNDNYVGGSRRYGGQVSALGEIGDKTDILIRYVYNNGKNTGSSLSNIVFPTSTFSEFTVDKLDDGRAGNVNLGTLTLNHDFGSAILTAATGYIDQKSNRDQDISIFLGEDTLLRRQGRAKTFSQEVRLASPKGETLEWIFGGYYQSSKIASIAQTDFLAPTSPDAPDSNTNSSFRQFAGFAEISWKFAENWIVKGGGRYAAYKTTQIDNLSGTPELSITDKAFTPRINLEFKPGNDQLYYIQAAKGFRPGGANDTPGPNECRGPVPDKFDPDSIWSYEGGAKIGFLNNKARLNASIFYSDWKNIPIFQLNFANAIDPAAPTVPNNPDCAADSFFRNLGKAVSKGAEVELVLRPSKGLSVSFSASYTEATLKDGGGSFANGQRLPASPGWNISTDVNYDFSISDTLNASVGGAVRHLSKYQFFLNEDFASANGFLGNPFLSNPNVGGYVTVDLRAGINGDKFGINAFLNNAFNTRGVTSINAFSSSGQAEQAITRPRTIGVSTHVNF
jgi:iron complex outermembrane recepter protein